MIFSKRHRFGVLRASGRVAGLTLPAVLCAGLCLSAAAQAEILPLSVAISRAAQADPAAMATQKRLAATEAGIRQAGVRPNPSVGLEAENVLGSGPYSGLSQAETTLSYQQPLERKSKREARIGAASAQNDLARAEGRVRTWEAMSAAQRLWVEAVVAEAETQLAGQRLKLAEQSQAEIRRRVSAARDPLFAGSLAEAEVATARIAHDQAAAKVRQLKTQLAALWGGATEFELEAKWLEDTPVISEPALMETPDIEVLRARQRLSAAQVRVETTRRVQDPTVSAGIRHFQGDGAVAFIIGGSIPLNRNDAYRGHIDRARADSEAASADIEVAERYRQRDITAATLRMADLAHEAKRIKSEVIPQAETALRQVREGFVRGGFTYRDVIGTQQTLMTAKARRLEVLKQFHIEQINRDRLSGKWVAPLPDVEAAQ